VRHSGLTTGCINPMRLFLNSFMHQRAPISTSSCTTSHSRTCGQSKQRRFIALSRKHAFSSHLRCRPILSYAATSTERICCPYLWQIRAVSRRACLTLSPSSSSTAALAHLFRFGDQVHSPDMGCMDWERRLRAIGRASAPPRVKVGDYNRARGSPTRVRCMFAVPSVHRDRSLIKPLESGATAVVE
jgi:hypothetical protein